MLVSVSYLMLWEEMEVPGLMSAGKSKYQRNVIQRFSSVSGK